MVNWQFQIRPFDKYKVINLLLQVQSYGLFTVRLILINHDLIMNGYSGQFGFLL